MIADYHLDEGDGLATIAALRSETAVDLAAILITADRSPALAELAAQAGISVLNKPVKPAALRALLSRIGATRIAAE